MTRVGPTQLNDAQQRVVEQLGASADQRPTFPDGLALGLREHLKQGLAGASVALGNDDVWVTKFMLNQVLGCEVRYLFEKDRPFHWTVPVARGTVAHKAIELSVHWRTTPVANDLVDEAIGSLSNDGSAIAEYLRGLPEADRAQLRSEAANATQAFLDGFPPLRSKPQWRPSVEVKGRHELFDGQVRLAGKVDLSLGGPTGDRSGRVFIDLKTGRRNQSHRDDLRYYALIETLRFGTPPRALASYYLDESRLSVEHVTADILWASADRVIAAINRVVALAENPAGATHRESLACRWCAHLPDCDIGQRFLDDTHEDEIELLS